MFNKNATLAGTITRSLVIVGAVLLLTMIDSLFNHDPIGTSKTVSYLC